MSKRPKSAVTSKKINTKLMTPDEKQYISNSFNDDLGEFSFPKRFIHDSNDGDPTLVLKKTKLLALLDTYQPHVLKHVGIGSYSTQQLEIFLKPIYQDRDIHNFQLKSIIHYFNEWKINIKSKMKQLEALITKSQPQAMSHQDIVVFKLQIIKRLQIAKEVNSIIAGRMQMIIQKEGSNYIGVQVQSHIENPINKGKPIGLDAQKNQTHQNHTKITHIFKEFKDYHQVITAILEIFTFIQDVAYIPNRQEIAVKYDKIRAISYEDFVEAMANGQESKVEKLMDRLLREIWPLVHHKIKQAMVMCISKNFEYFGDEKNRSPAEQFFIEKKIAKTNNTGKAQKQCQRRIIKNSGRTESRQPRDAIINLNLVEFKIEKMFPYLLKSLLYHLRMETRITKEMTGFRSYLVSSIKQLAKMYLIAPQTIAHDQIPNFDYTNFSRMANQITSNVEKFVRNVKEHARQLGSQEYQQINIKSDQIWKEIKEKISPLFQLLKVGFQLCMMRLVGLLRNHLVKEDNILHLVKNQGMSYKNINEAMISGVRLLSINLIAKQVTSEHGKANQQPANQYLTPQGQVKISEFAHFLNRSARDYSSVLVSVLSKQVDLKMLVKNNFSRDFSSSDLIIGYFGQVRDILEEFNLSRNIILEILDQSIVNNYITKILPVTQVLVEAIKRSQYPIIAEWRSTTEAISESFNSLENVIKAIKAQRLASGADYSLSSRTQLVNIDSFIEILKYSETALQSIPLLKNPKKFFTKLQTQGIDLLTHPQLVSEFQRLNEKVKTYRKLLAQQQLIDYVIKKPQLANGILGVIVKDKSPDTILLKKLNLTPTENKQRPKKDKTTQIKQQKPISPKQIEGVDKQKPMNIKQTPFQKELYQKNKLQKYIDLLVMTQNTSGKKTKHKKRPVSSKQRKNYSTQGVKSKQINDNKNEDTHKRKISQDQGIKIKYGEDIYTTPMKKNEQYESNNPLAVIFPYVPLHVSRQFIASQPPVVQKLQKNYFAQQVSPQIQNLPEIKPIAQSEHISEIITQKQLILSISILEEVRCHTLILNGRVGYTIDNSEQLSELEIFNLWLDEKFAELESIRNGHLVITVINQMIKLAIREWDQIIKRNQFVKNINLQHCIQILLLSQKNKARKGELQPVSEDLAILKDLSEYFESLLKKIQSSSGILGLGHDSALITNQDTLQVIVKCLRQQNYGNDLILNLKKFMKNNGISCLEYWLEYDTQKGLVFILVAEGDSVGRNVSRIIVLRKRMQSKSSRDLGNEENIKETQIATSIFRRNQPDSTSANKTQPNPLNEIFKKLINPDSSSNNQPSINPNFAIEIALTHQMVYDIIFHFIPSIINRYKLAKARELFEYFDYYSLSLTKSIRSVIDYLNHSKAEDAKWLTDLNLKIDQVNNSIDSLLKEITRIIIEVCFKPFFAAYSLLQNIAQLQKLAHSKLLFVIQSWLSHNMTQDQPFNTLQTTNEPSLLTTLYISITNIKIIFSQKIIKEKKPIYIDIQSQFDLLQENNRFSNQCQLTRYRMIFTFKKILKLIKFQQNISTQNYASNFVAIGVKADQSSQSQLIAILDKEQTNLKGENPNYSKMIIQYLDSTFGQHQSNILFGLINHAEPLMSILQQQYAKCLQISQFHTVIQTNSLTTNSQKIGNQSMNTTTEVTETSILNQFTYVSVNLSVLFDHLIAQTLIINPRLLILNPPINSLPYSLAGSAEIQFSLSNITEIILKSLNQALHQNENNDFGQTFQDVIFPNFLEANNLTSKFTKWSDQFSKKIAFANFFCYEHYNALKMCVKITNSKKQKNSKVDFPQTPSQIAVHNILQNFIRFVPFIFQNKELKILYELKKGKSNQNFDLITQLKTRQSLVEYIYNMIKQTLQSEIKFMDQFSKNLSLSSGESVDLILIKQIGKVQQKEKAQVTGILLRKGTQSNVNNQNMNINESQLKDSTTSNFLNLQRVSMLETKANKQSGKRLSQLSLIEQFILENYFWTNQKHRQDQMKILLSNQRVQKKYANQFREAVQIDNVKNHSKKEDVLPSKVNNTKPMNFKAKSSVIPVNGSAIQKKTGLVIQEYQCRVKSKFIILNLFTDDRQNSNQPEAINAIQKKNPDNQKQQPNPDSNLSNKFQNRLAPINQKFKELSEVFSKLYLEQQSLLALEMEIGQIGKYAEWKQKLLGDSSVIMSNKSIKDAIQNTPTVRMLLLEQVQTQRQQTLLETHNHLKQINSSKEELLINLEPLDLLESVNPNALQDNKSKPSIFSGLNLQGLIHQMNRFSKANQKVNPKINQANQMALDVSEIFDHELELESKIITQQNIIKKEIKVSKDWSNSQILKELMPMLDRIHPLLSQMPQLKDFSPFQLFLSSVRDFSDHKISDKLHLNHFKSIKMKNQSWLNNLFIRFQRKKTQSNQQDDVILEEKLFEADPQIIKLTTAEIKTLNTQIFEFLEDRKYIKNEQKVSSQQIELQFSKLNQIFAHFIKSIAKLIGKIHFLSNLTGKNTEVRPSVIYTLNQKPSMVLVPMSPHPLNLGAPFIIENFPFQHKNQYILTQYQLFSLALSSLISKLIFTQEYFLPFNNSVAKLAAQREMLENKLKQLYELISLEQINKIIDWRNKKSEEQSQKQKRKDQENVKKILFIILIRWGQILQKIIIPTPNPIIPPVEPQTPPIVTPKPEIPPYKKPIYWKKGQTIGLQFEFTLSEGWQVNQIVFIQDLPTQIEQKFNKKKQDYKKLQKDKKDKKYHSFQDDLSNLSDISVDLTERIFPTLIKQPMDEFQSQSLNYFYKSYQNHEFKHKFNDF